MDVLFINSGASDKDYFMRYVGPYKIAHWIRKHGYSCQVIDFVSQLTEKQIIAAIEKFITHETKVIAISTTFLCNFTYPWPNNIHRRMPYELWSALTYIKDTHPELKFILGGYKSERTHGYGIFDATVMSYTDASEDIFLEYIDHVIKGGPAPAVKTHWPEQETLLHENHPRPWYYKANNPVYSIELDDFKFTPQDAILHQETLPLDVSRGCIFACKFCQYPHLGKKKLDYIRGMQYIKEELIYNYETFGTFRYWILDDTFNDTEWKLSEFLKVTQELPFKIEYFAYTRADLIYRFPDMAYMLKESGCMGAYHGLESLHLEASSVVGKAWSGKHAREFIPKLYHDIWKKEVPQHLSFIVGLPGEDKTSIEATRDWFIDNQLDSIGFHQLGLYGTDNRNSVYTIQSEFDKNAEKYGYKFISIKAENQELAHDFKVWENDKFNFYEAKALARETNNVLRDYSNVGAWSKVVLRGYGFSWDFLLGTPKSKIPQKYIDNRTAEYFREYYKKLMRL
jgi:hypothetical protein